MDAAICHAGSTQGTKGSFGFGLAATGLGHLPADHDRARAGGCDVEVLERSGCLVRHHVGSPGYLHSQPIVLTPWLPQDTHSCDARWLTSKDLAALLSRDSENLQGRILGGMVKKGLPELRFPDVPSVPNKRLRPPRCRNTDTGRTHRDKGIKFTAVALPTKCSILARLLI